MFEVAPSPTAPELRFLVAASPEDPGWSGERYFVTDQRGVIYEALTPIPLDPDAGPPAGAAIARKG